MTVPRSRSCQDKDLDAGIFQPEISSFRLHLGAEGKAAKTIRTYTEAVQWFAVCCLAGEAGCCGWEQVGGQDVQQWMIWLLGRYSSAYASNQYRGLQQFFRWLAAEKELPDPMAGLRPPKVTGKLVPVFTAVELTALERACAGRGFAQSRDAAIIAVFRSSGIRLSELAAIRYSAGGSPRCGDLDLERREITVTGKGGRPRIVKITFDAARAVDRYLRVRARHAQAYRPQLWLGVSGIYQVITRRGEQAGVQVWPHRFRHHFSHTWQMSRIAFNASFGTSREHALPAAQRAALRGPGLPELRAATVTWDFIVRLDLMQR